MLDLQRYALSFVKLLDQGLQTDFCLARKVRCDLRRPDCGNCTKARRLCQGYGIQLSWPRDGDRKRAKISRDTFAVDNTLGMPLKKFLNTSSWDIILSEQLVNGINPCETRSQPDMKAHSTKILRVACSLRTMKVPRPTYLSPIVTNSEQSHLLGFCKQQDPLDLFFLLSGMRSQ